MSRLFTARIKTRLILHLAKIGNKQTETI